MRHTRIGFALSLLCVSAFACSPKLMNDVGELNEGGVGSTQNGSGATATGGGTGATGSGATSSSAKTGGGGTGALVEGEGGAGPEQPDWAQDPQNCGEESCPGPTGCEPAAAWAGATATNGVMDFEPIEVWHGYMVNPIHPLPTEDDRLALYVKTRTGSAITGAVVFGEGTPPAPATDPAIGYIPDEIFGDKDWLPPGAVDNFNSYLNTPWPGYALSLLGGAVTGTRLQFAAYATESWRGWCEMVLGYAPDESPTGLCVPGDGGGVSSYVCTDSVPECQQCLVDSSGTPSEPVQFDCRKYELCNHQVCDCQGECCTASQRIGFNFDLELDTTGTVLTGKVIEGETGPDVDIHLTLDE